MNDSASAPKSQTDSESGGGQVVGSLVFTAFLFLWTFFYAIFFVIALVFVYRSFYSMRIPPQKTGSEDHLVIREAGVGR